MPQRAGCRAHRGRHCHQRHGRHGQPARAPVADAVGEQQREFGLRGRLHGLQVGGAVVGQGFQPAAQRAPVAAAHGVCFSGFGRVAHHHQLHLHGAQVAEPGVQQRELACMVTPRAGGRGVPQQRHILRHGAWPGLVGDGDFGVEITRVAEALGGHQGRARCGRQRDVQLAAALVVGTREGDAAAGAVLGHGRDPLRPQLCRERAGRHVGDAHGHLQSTHCAVAELQWHAPQRPCGGGDGLADLQRDAPRATRRQRIDMQLVVIALRGLQQRRVHAATHHVLEDLAALVLVHRHSGPQRAFDVQCEAGDRLALAQRELQLGGQVVVVGVEEFQLDARGRRQAHDLCLHDGPLHAHGLAGLGCDDAHRGQRLFIAGGLCQGGAGGHQHQRARGQQAADGAQGRQQGKVGCGRGRQAGCGHGRSPGADTGMRSEPTSLPSRRGRVRAWGAPISSP